MDVARRRDLGGKWGLGVLGEGNKKNLTKREMGAWWRGNFPFPFPLVTFLISAFQSANDDPLASWFRQHQDVSGRMSARIQNLAATISQRVAWSFLIEPGRPKTDLSVIF